MDGRLGEGAPEPFVLCCGGKAAALLRGGCCCAGMCVHACAACVRTPAPRRMPARARAGLRRAALRCAVGRHPFECECRQCAFALAIQPNGW
eukprot:92625-Chlamydomonas_euryale.AAC.1